MLLDNVLNQFCQNSTTECCLLYLKLSIRDSEGRQGNFSKLIVEVSSWRAYTGDLFCFVGLTVKISVVFFL